MTIHLIEESDFDLTRRCSSCREPGQLHPDRGRARRSRCQECLGTEIIPTPFGARILLFISMYSDDPRYRNPPPAAAGQPVVSPGIFHGETRHRGRSHDRSQSWVWCCLPPQLAFGDTSSREHFCICKSAVRGQGGEHFCICKSAPVLDSIGPRPGASVYSESPRNFLT